MSGGEAKQMLASQQQGPHPLKGEKAPEPSRSPATNDKEVLFQSWALGPHVLKNRLVYAPMTRCRATNPGLEPEDRHVEYYSQRARGCEGGLIITEGTVISETGHG